MHPLLFKRKNMSCAKRMILAIVSLVIGCLIYLLFRQDILAMYWFGNPKWIESLRINIEYDGNLLTYCLLYCLSDALWYFSLLLLQFLFYDKNIILCRVLLILTIAMPFILEALQYFHIICGTFDILDVLFYSTTLLIVLKIEKHEKK